ncbi:MAG TPA: hypothetical protein VGK73_34210 [Polyangiaceae bacterium]
MTAGRALGFLAGASWLLCGGPVLAQGGAAAQALFEQGVRELEAGHFDKACPALAESQRLDPHPGTLFALADCEAKSGKVASAVGHFQDYLGLTSRMAAEQLERHAERIALAREQVESLRPRVPTLALQVPEPAPPGLVVERDGLILQGASLGVPLPVDPGEHVIVARLPGRGERRLTVTLSPGETKQLVLELPRESPAPSAAGSAPTGAPPSEANGSKLRNWGWGLGAAGLTGVLVGSVTGMVVLKKKATVTDHCLGSACDAEGKSAADSGRNLATVSTVAFGVGVTAAVASVVILIATEPRSPKRASQALAPLVSLGPDGAWAGVAREF